MTAIKVDADCIMSAYFSRSVVDACTGFVRQMPRCPCMSRVFKGLVFCSRGAAAKGPSSMIIFGNFSKIFLDLVPEMWLLPQNTRP